MEETKSRETLYRRIRWSSCMLGGPVSREELRSQGCVLPPFPKRAGSNPYAPPRTQPTERGRTTKP
jgi:hypothetical protein